jgi:hypothetical protein
MMIAPATYVEMELAGKNREQAIEEVKSLWKEIRRLKKIIEEEPDSEEMMICPMPDVRVSVYRDYIEAAREYFKDKGWEYEPEREEIADKALNDRLQDIQSIVIEYGGYFGGTEKRTITFEGEKILVEKEYTLRILSPEELQQNPAEEFHDMEKAEFLEEFADLHLGEWEKEYEDLNVLDGTQWSVVIKFSSGKAFKSYGSNRFPYNFSGFLDLVRISESDM